MYKLIIFDRANTVGNKAQEIKGMGDLCKWKNSLLEIRIKDWECRKWEDHVSSY